MPMIENGFYTIDSLINLSTSDLVELTGMKLGEACSVRNWLKEDISRLRADYSLWDA